MTTQHTPGRLYADRDIINQGPHYVAHVSAMTVEALHSKSDIAAELAHRDIVIADLLAALKDAAMSLETISILSGRKTFGQPPIETYMEDFMQVRGYANSRMTVARAAIAKAEGGAK